MGERARPGPSEPAPPLSDAAEVPSSRTLDPMEGDARGRTSAQRREERNQATVARGGPGASRGISSGTLTLLFLAVVLASGNVTWWLTRYQRPAAVPASASMTTAAPTAEPSLSPALPPPVALVADPPPVAEPLASGAQDAPAPTAVVKTTPAKPAVPSAPSTPKRKPAPSSTRLVPLFDLSSRPR